MILLIYMTFPGLEITLIQQLKQHFSDLEAPWKFAEDPWQNH